MTFLQRKKMFCPYLSCDRILSQLIWLYVSALSYYIQYPFMYGSHLCLVVTLPSHYMVSCKYFISSHMISILLFFCSYNTTSWSFYGSLSSLSIVYSLVEACHSLLDLLTVIDSDGDVTCSIYSSLSHYQL